MRVAGEDAFEKWVRAFSGDFGHDLCETLFRTELEVIVRRNEITLS